MLMGSKWKVDYQECSGPIDVAGLNNYDGVIFNLHPGIGNAMHSAPFATKARQIGIYHDGPLVVPFDRWLFSDPSGNHYGDLRCIGRPLPDWNSKSQSIPEDETTIVGLSGLVGAWAPIMVETVSNQIPEARIRLHLASSDHCDPAGLVANSTGIQCQSINKNVEVEYDFKTMDQMQVWLEGNNLNCYIRTPAPSSGISSALDLAMAVRRPLAINNHPMFRHVAATSPEICIENNNLMDIMAMGCSPTIKHRERNSRERVLGELEEAILSLFA